MQPKYKGLFVRYKGLFVKTTPQVKFAGFAGFAGVRGCLRFTTPANPPSAKTAIAGVFVPVFVPVVGGNYK
jgi:hypothetical protein